MNFAKFLRTFFAEHLRASAFEFGYGTGSVRRCSVERLV